MKCTICNKKVSFIEEITLKCKCNNIYCKKHYQSFNHDCTYNYVEEYKKKCTSNLVKFDNRLCKI